LISVGVEAIDIVAVGKNPFEEDPNPRTTCGQNIGMFGRQLTGRIVYTESVLFHVLPHRAAYQRRFLIAALACEARFFRHW